MRHIILAMLGIAFGHLWDTRPKVAFVRRWTVVLDGRGST